MVGYHSFGTNISRKDYTLEETKEFHKALDKTDYASYIRSFKYLESHDNKHKYTEGVEFEIQTSAFSTSNILNTERT